LSGLGLLLGVIGGIVALMRGGRGIGFPIAGSAISGFATAFGVFWLFLLGAVATAPTKDTKRETAEAGAKDKTDATKDRTDKTGAKQEPAPTLLDEDGLRTMHGDLFYNPAEVRNELAKDEENNRKYKGKRFQFRTTANYRINEQPLGDGKKAPQVLFYVRLPGSEHSLMVFCDCDPAEMDFFRNVKDTSEPITLTGVYTYKQRGVGGDPQISFKEGRVVRK
jgi:hypothetical protein